MIKVDELKSYRRTRLRKDVRLRAPTKNGIKPSIEAQKASDIGI